MRADVIGHMERFVRGPSECRFGFCIGIGTQRFAMHARAALLGAPKSDVRAHGNKRGTRGFRTRGMKRRLDRLDIVPVVHARRMPSVGIEPLKHILGKREVGIAFN